MGLWLILMLACLIKPAMATSGGISMSPPFVDIVIEKTDKQKTFELVVGNNSGVIQSINLSVVDFGSLDESGGVAFLGSKTLASWMNLEKDWVTVEPQKTEKVKVTILNKESLTAGGHYGAILGTLKNEDKVDKDVIGLNQAIATLVYIQKKDGEIKSLLLNKTDFRKSWWKIPDNFQVRFENKGNVHLVPRGKIEISGYGRVWVKGIINEDSGKILPNSFRTINVPIINNKLWIWPGNYQIKIDYRFDGKDGFETKKFDYFYFGKEGWILVVTGLLAIVFWLIWKKRF